MVSLAACVGAWVEVSVIVLLMASVGRLVEVSARVALDIETEISSPLWLVVTEEALVDSCAVGLLAMRLEL